MALQNVSKVVSQKSLFERALPIVPIVIAQQLVLLPLYFFIPFWILLLNITIALVIIWQDRKNKIWITRRVKIVITLVAIVGVFISFQSFSGRNAGVALISVMYGLKILETNKTRDANLLLSLGFFMLVSGFLFSQKPWIAFYQLIPVVAILNALVSIHSLDSQKNNQVSLKNITKNLSKYFLFALPIMLVFFVFFPRLSGPIWRMPGSSSGTTGISDSMSPGDISSLKFNDEIAFRVEFEGDEPNPMQLYWL